MASLLIKDIGKLTGLHTAETRVLRGKELAHFPCLDDAWLLCKGDRIQRFGPMSALPTDLPDHVQVISAEGGYVFPSWCDSHTHIVYAAPREDEFVMKIQGKSYEEIAAAGGGILNSALKMASADEDELFESAAGRLRDMIRQGTGALEIKSGYGLNPASEFKMLRVIKRLKQSFPIPIKASFLAAHTYPAAFRNDHQGYIRQIIEEMLPAVADQGLADYMDVFCENGFFSPEETAQLLTAAARYGLKPKIHANQLAVSGGVQVGVEHQALSVDHLEALDAGAIDCLRNSDTMATLLPSCSFYLNIPYADARGLMDAHIPVALASDYNPGSTPSGNMNLVVSLACIKLKMLPEEAFNAATINGAAALELSGEIGSITPGKLANFFITRPMSSMAFLPYSFGQLQIKTIILNGKIW